MDIQPEPFDFDHWKTLFETDPDAFEVQRRKLLNAEIQRAPAAMQPRLRGLQWRVDAIRSRYKHPTVSSAKLFEMMWEKVYGEGGLLEALTSPRFSRAPDSPSNIIRLQPKNPKSR